MRRRFASPLRGYVAAVSSLLLLAGVGCDEPTAPEPDAVRGPLARTALTGADVVRYPNSERYRDQGARPATGRSGGAVVQTRSLLYANGRTVIDIATGDIDEPASQLGIFERVQFKVLDPEGTQLAVYNFNQPAERTRLRFFSAAMPRGTPTQLLANVGELGGTPNGSRIGVVSASDVVRLAPDLFVESLQLPAEATTHAPVNIAATIRERNGDVGARSDCMLLVDGAVVDASAEIWVDAGDAVTCVFTFAFPEPRTWNVEVRTGNTRPADFDRSNDGAGGTIDVREIAGLRWEARAFDESFSYESRTENRWRLLDGSRGSEWVDETRQSGRFQYAGVMGSTADAFTFPRAPLADVRLSQTSGGRVIDAAEYETLPPDWIDEWPGVLMGCASRATGVGAWFYLCSSTQAVDGVARSSTWFDYTRYAGTVTYHSAGYSRTWDHSVPFEEYYTYNSGGDVVEGVLADYGDDYTLEVAFTDGGSRFAIGALVPLQPFDGSWIAPYDCVSWSDDITVGSSCFGGSGQTVGRAGNASGIVSAVPTAIGPSIVAR